MFERITVDAVGFDGNERLNVRCEFADGHFAQFDVKNGKITFSAKEISLDQIKAAAKFAKLNGQWTGYRSELAKSKDERSAWFMSQPTFVLDD